MDAGGLSSIDLPFDVGTDTERRIVADEEWQRGAAWGDPRPGHPEGAIVHHVTEVLSNVDRYAASPEERQRLRVVALTHDTFKHLVDISKPRVGDNHHGMIARRFTERYSQDHDVLEITELHDEAYNSYSQGVRNAGRWGDAEERATRLIDRLGPALPMYRRFYRCDNATGTKAQDSLVWFEDFCLARNL